MKLRELAEEVDRRQAEAKAIAARARRLEVAINIKPLWIKRGKIDDQLERFASLRPLEEGTIDSLDDFNKRIEEHERQRDILKGQRQQLRDEAKRLGINDVLVRNGQRLEALLEQQDWLQAIERMAGELADEVKQLEARLASENERLSHEWTGAGKMPPRITTDIVEQLAPQARAIEATEQMLASAKHELEVHRTGEHEVPLANRIGDGRRRKARPAEGRRRGRRPRGPASPPAAARTANRTPHKAKQKTLAGAGARPGRRSGRADRAVRVAGRVFVVGFVGRCRVVLDAGDGFGKYGGWIAVGGIGGSVVAWLIKFLQESTASDRFDACHHQIETLLDQIEDAEEEQDELDRSCRLRRLRRTAAATRRAAPGRAGANAAGRKPAT